jgi:hypothetical protein
MRSCQIIVTETKLLHHAGPEVVHDHIRLRHEIVHRLATLRVFHVDRHAPLVPVQAGKGQAHAMDKRPPAATPVARAGPLDLDHVGPVVRQDLGPNRTLIDVREIEYTDSAQRRLGRMH